MNIELNNATENEVEYAEKSNHLINKRFKKYEIFVFLGCLVLAFLIWCYANYLDDPIIQKEITVDFVLIKAEEQEKISIHSKKIVVYGEQSVVADLVAITNYVDRNLFAEDNTKINYEIDYPDGVHSHQTHIEIELLGSSK